MLLANTFLASVAWGQAQKKCTSRDNALDTLAQRFGEEQVARGLTSEGTMIEMLTTKSGHTWTIIVTDKNGQSCLIMSGEAWQWVKEPKPRGQPI